jgi:hypothetical protein
VCIVSLFYCVKDRLCHVANRNTCLSGKAFTVTLVYMASTYVAMLTKKTLNCTIQQFVCVSHIISTALTQYHNVKFPQSRDSHSFHICSCWPQTASLTYEVIQSIFFIAGLPAVERTTSLLLNDQWCRPFHSAQSGIKHYSTTQVGLWAASVV